MPSSRSPRRRIAEIAEAASRGDDGAVEAAVARLRVDRSPTSTRQTGAPAGRALTPCSSTRRCCATSSSGCPTQAQAGIERAIANSTVAIDHLDQASATSRPAAGRRRGRQRPTRRPERGRRQRRRQRQRGRQRQRAAATADGERRRERQRRRRQRRRQRQRWWRQPERRRRERQRWRRQPDTPAAGATASGNGGKPDRTPKPERPEGAQARAGRRATDRRPRDGGDPRDRAGTAAHAGARAATLAAMTARRMIG